MVNVLKFQHSKESKVFLVSDTHFRHEKLVEKRGFKTIQEHDETLIKTWNERVRPQDQVIFLGDFVLGAGKDSRQVCEDLFNVLNGQITFLWGNHRAGVKQIYKECINLQFHLDPEKYEIYPVTWNNKVTFVGESLLAHIKTIDVPKRQKQNYFVFCSHFAHRIWVDGNKGVLHASGHSHSSDPESNPDHPNTKRLDCCIENFGGPISFDKFLEIMDSKEHIVLDHHDSSINPSF